MLLKMKKSDQICLDEISRSTSDLRCLFSVNLYMYSVIVIAKENEISA